MSKKIDYATAVHARLEWSKAYKDTGKSGGEVFAVFEGGTESRIGYVTRTEDGKYLPVAMNGSKTELTPNSNLQAAVRTILTFKGCAPKLELVRVKVEAAA